MRASPFLVMTARRSLRILRLEWGFFTGFSERSTHWRQRKKELDTLAGKARTPTEHRALEEYFLTLATRYTDEGKAHVAWALTYRGTRIAQAAVHHDRLATLSRDSAKEATEAAAMHKQLAGIAR